MLNAIFLGLSALSSITGFASGIKYNTTTEDLNNVSRFICENKNIEVCEFNKLDKIYFNDLYTISGENRYIEVVFDNGYVIYDKKTDSIDEYSGNTITECTSDILVTAVTNDFNSYSSYMNATYKFEPIGKYEKCPEGTYKVALVCYKTGWWIFTSQDYHWYRQDADGYWSHKQGTTAVKRTDESGKLITDPENCDRGSYTNFVGYFAVTPWSNLYAQ